MQTSPSEQEIVLSTWDLAGQHVYYATHQCFLTSNTLYLVVWNVQHGKEGIDRLAPWLLNIQVPSLSDIVLNYLRSSFWLSFVRALKFYNEYYLLCWKQCESLEDKELAVLGSLKSYC